MRWEPYESKLGLGWISDSGEVRYQQERPAGKIFPANRRLAAVAEASPKATEDWVPYRGSKGGTGWQNVSSGEVRYVKDRPGSGRKESKDRTPDLRQQAKEAEQIIRDRGDDLEDIKNLGVASVDIGIANDLAKKLNMGNIADAADFFGVADPKQWKWMIEKGIPNWAQAYEGLGGVIEDPEELAEEMPEPEPDPKSFKKTPGIGPAYRDPFRGKQLVSKSDTSGGHNTTKIVEFSDGTKGVYKPTSGEGAEIYPAFPPGTLAGREVAAAIVASNFGMGDMVGKATLAGDQFQEEGSLAEFLNSNSKASSEFSKDDIGDMHDDVELNEQLERMVYFDLLIGNADRHRGNWLINEDPDTGKKKIQLIDHGYSFPENNRYTHGYRSPRLRTLEFTGFVFMMSDEMRDKLMNFVGNRNVISNQLSSYISREEIDSMFDRANYMAATWKDYYSTEREQFSDLQLKLHSGLMKGKYGIKEIMESTEDPDERRKLVAGKFKDEDARQTAWMTIQYIQELRDRGISVPFAKST